MAVVVELGLLVNWQWRIGARSRVLVAEWQSSDGGGRVAVGVAEVVLVMATVLGWWRWRRRGRWSGGKLAVARRSSGWLWLWRLNGG